MKHRMCHLEMTQVGNYGPFSAMRHTKDGIRYTWHTMRTAGARKDCIQSVSDEFHIGHPAHKATAAGIGLT
jgi:hypothetical protein